MLSIAEIRRLADGSIYHAQYALQEELIDEIGYMDDAIELAKSLAAIEKAYVFEYKRPFSLTGWLSSSGESHFKLDRKTLYELTAPQLLYLWTP